MTTLPGTSGRRRVYLLRHGAVDYFHADGTRLDDARMVALTAQGRGQAALMSELLAGIRFDRALHTGLPRTRETAEIVLGPTRDLRLEEERDLREIELGHLDELPPDRIDAEFTYGFEGAAEPEASLARGEPFRDFYHRVTESIQRLLASPGWHRALVVAHGGTNRALLSWVTGGGLDALSTFEQDECCLNILDVDLIDGQLVRRYLRVVNLTPYNLVKDGLYLTTMERTVHDRARRSADASSVEPSPRPG